MTGDSKDINIKMKLTLEEMYTGVSKKIKYEKKIPCASCHKSKDCAKCSGTGVVLKEVVESMEIPEGIEDKMVLIFKDKGHAYDEKKKLWRFFSNLKGAPKNSFGSLIVKIEEEKHDVFIRDKYNLIYRCQISKSELIGKDKPIEIEHLDSELIKVLIPKNIDDGKVLRIQGKGFKCIAENKKGSLLIIVNII